MTFFKAKVLSTTASVPSVVPAAFVPFSVASPAVPCSTKRVGQQDDEVTVAVQCKMQKRAGHDQCAHAVCLAPSVDASEVWATSSWLHVVEVHEA